MSMQRSLPLVTLLLLAACSKQTEEATADTSSEGSDTTSGSGSGDVTEGSDTTSGSGSGAADTTPDATPPTWPTSTPARIGGTRPAKVNHPRAFTPGKEYPLIILLHGYGASGLAQDLYIGLSVLGTTEFDAITVVPDGTLNSNNQRYWNASAACCAFSEANPPDDVAYIRALIAEAKASMPIDAGRVYLFGHSNGGFMSYRMACEASDAITAFVSLAGADSYADADCPATTTPVSGLQMHGTADDTIAYDGSSSGPLGIGAYAGALVSAQNIARRAGCDTTGAAGAELDLMTTLEGTETTTLAFDTGCRAGADAALWTLRGATHIPVINPAGTRAALTWLLRHDRTP